MTVTVRMIAPHSGSKDHLAMSGGTLTADKQVDGDAPLVLRQVFFPVAEIDPGSSDEDLRVLFSGVHSIEHSLASPLAGDLRARVGEAAGDPDVGARLVDMSPYVPDLLDAARPERLTIGFRSTVVSEAAGLGADDALPREALVAAYGAALDLIRDHVKHGGEVPFATPESCGQYDMHSADAALDLIDRAPHLAGSGSVAERRTATGARRLYVCDLRLVKPRLPEAFGQRVLDPLAGHLISQAVEASGLFAGNFGCATGEYLLVPDPDGLAQEAALRQAHITVATTLLDLATYSGSDPLRAAAASDARFALDHIARAAPDVLAAAQG